MHFHRIRLGIADGAITAFGQQANGALFGLTTAHTLDVNVEELEIWDNHLNTGWTYCGFVDYDSLIKTDGRLEPDDYGRIDAGLFSVDDSMRNHLQDFLQPIWQLSPWLKYPPTQLKNKTVLGYSGEYKKKVIGEIDDIRIQLNVEQKIIGCDLGIRFIQGETTIGDSGMLWYDEDENPLAMHFAGYPRDHNKYSAATLLNRVLDVYASYGFEWLLVDQERVQEVV